MVVTGIGQCCWDQLVVVDSYPMVDSKKEVLCWEEQGGGPVATALVTLARMGISCRFAGIVGDDNLGSRILKSLSDEGIGTAAVVTRRNGISQKAFIVIEKGTGLRTIFWQRPDAEPLRSSEMREDLLEGSSFLLLDGLMAEASLAAAAGARRRQIPILLDAGRMRPGMMELAALADYVVAGEQFFLDLGWDGGKESFIRLAAGIGAPVVTVTMGTEGSFTWRSKDFFHQPAFPVEVVDTTGAGDVFHGAYIYALLQGWDLREVVAFAAATAALKCRHVGGRSGIPSVAEARALANREALQIHE